MIIDLQGNGPEVYLGKATAGLVIKFPHSVSEVYFLAGERRQVLVKNENYEQRDFWLDRPNGVIRGITHLCVEGPRSHPVLWPAMHVRGVVSIKLSHKSMDLTTSIWLSLWDDMEEDSNQLQFTWPTDRFSLIG
jgi:hypothetical protein